MRVTNKEIPAMVSSRTEFKANSAYAQIDTAGVYNVYSYRTLIASYGKDGREFFNEEKYSQTTTKLQNSIRGVK